MNEPTPVAYSPASADPNGLMHIGAVASHNIAAVLGYPPSAAAAIETAIKDEINAMSSHFTLAFHDIQTQYEAEVLKLSKEKDDFITGAQAREQLWIKSFEAKIAEIKSTFNYVSANTWHVIASLAAAFVAGAVAGHLV